MMGPKTVEPMVRRGIIVRYQKSASKTGEELLQIHVKKVLKTLANQQENSKTQLQKMKTIQGYEFGAKFSWYNYIPRDFV